MKLIKRKNVIKLYPRDYVVFFMFFVLFALYFFRSFAQIDKVDEGIRLHAIQQEIIEVKKENAILKQKLLEASSFQTIENEALRMGMIESSPNEYYYVK